MTEREFFVYTVADEAPRFERLLRAIPTEHTDYRPDPKSKTALELASSMAMEAGTLKKILETGDLDFAENSATQYENGSDAAVALVAGLHEAKTFAESMDDATWDTDARLHMGGANEWKSPKGKMVLGFILDLVHHRGQLSTYIRAMGGKLPSIYGPSADSQE